MCTDSGSGHDEHNGLDDIGGGTPAPPAPTLPEPPVGATENAQQLGQCPEVHARTAAEGDINPLRMYPCKGFAMTMPFGAASMPANRHADGVFGDAPEGNEPGYAEVPMELLQQEGEGMKRQRSYAEEEDWPLSLDLLEPVVL